MALIESSGPDRSGDAVVRRWSKVLEKLSLAPDDWPGFARSIEGLANVAGAGMDRKGCEVEFAKRVLPHLSKAFSEARAIGVNFGGPQPWAMEYVVNWGDGAEDEPEEEDFDEGDEPEEEGFEPGLG